MASAIFSATGIDVATKEGLIEEHPLKSLKIDTVAIKTRYDEERAKRNLTGVSQFKHPTGTNSHFRNDVLEPVSDREPITKETSVLICGAGFAGLITAVNLKKDHSVDDFVMIDKAGGFGGTWYWNQYPGVACDVEAQLYLPFLEETGYTPKERFPYGPEIREQVARIEEQWNLTPHAYFHTEATAMKWDESLRRWHVWTNRKDHFIAQFVVLATGTFHEIKLPGIPGIETFRKPHFHSSRWDYNETGGSPTSWNLAKLADKSVGIIGTGASAVQLVPQLAKDVKKLYVFQRTPSSISIRSETRTAEEPASEPEKGWQRAAMEEFANILQGNITDRDCSAVEGLESLTIRALVKEAQAYGTSLRPEDIPELMQLADFRHMEKLRALIESTVKDKTTAELLKPWFPFMCKRPAFNNDYLATFNRPNVELVDTKGKGVTRLTETGVLAGGKEYPVDLLVYSTGFDFETDVDFYQRTGIEIVGTAGQQAVAEQETGPATLFGIHLRGYPNLLNIGTAQSGVTANWTHTAHVAGEHVAAVVAAVLDKKEDGGRSAEVIEPSEEAVEAWGKQAEEGYEMRLQFNLTCPPGYYNKQGQPEGIHPRTGFYSKGIIEWQRVMREWRKDGLMDGMEIR